MKITTFNYLRKSIFSIVILLILSSALIAQDNKVYILNAKIQDIEHPSLYLENIMIINSRTQQGKFITDNKVSISIQPTDTIMISASGYSLKKVCFKDSSLDADRVFTINLNRLSVELKEVTIFQQRDWNFIEHDLQGLGYKESDYKLTGVDAWQSPVTALYQAFSRKERSKRKVAELENDDLRKALLKEIIHIYIKNKMIILPEDHIDDFIESLGLNDVTLKAMSQYELALFIKDRCAFYRGER